MPDELLEGSSNDVFASSEAAGAQFETLFQYIPIGLTVTDTDGRVVRANDRALRILRLTPADLAAAPPWTAWEAYHLDGRPYSPDERAIARSLRDGEIVTAERLELVVGRGVHVVLEVSSAPIRAVDGRVTGAMLVFQDVTMRERQERVEREFVTNAAHELQSPLAAIISAVEVLQAGAKDSPERDRFLAHLERETQRLAKLARALLVLARAQLGAEEPRAELIELCPFLREVAARTTPTKGVDVAVVCPQELAIVTNRELLEQALLNLAGNAARHTRQGRIELTARGEDGRVEISVIDTGSGIAAGERPRVFERFYRGDRKSAEGFGLGLAIVRASVDALGGELELDSTVGAGTIVRLRLPTPAQMTVA